MRMLAAAFFSALPTLWVYAAPPKCGETMAAKESHETQREKHLVKAEEYTVPKAYTNEAGKVLLYRWTTPTIMHPAHPKIDHAKKCPLVIYLHGAGSRGNDNVTQRRKAQ